MLRTHLGTHKLYLIKCLDQIGERAQRKNGGTCLTLLYRQTVIESKIKWAENTVSVEEFEVPFSGTKYVAPNDACTRIEFEGEKAESRQTKKTNATAVK